MTFATGNLRIDNGTTMNVLGPITWTIESGANVVNDGLIDLGSEGVIVESANEPVTGTGIERSAPPLGASWPINGPGGLGLTISIPSTEIAIVVTRGHIPRDDADAGASIARWFGVDGLPDLPPQGSTVNLRYDETELNGLVESMLSPFASAGLAGPWVDTDGSVDTVDDMLTAPLQPGATYFTGFASDQQSATTTNLVPAFGMEVRPSITEDLIMVYPPPGTGSILIMDAAGRVAFVARAVEGGTTSLDVSSLTPGAYNVLSDSGALARFMKR